MTKLNPTTMKTQYDGQYDTFCRKNHDYGNSFEESLDQFGIIASLVRMQDKMLRLQSLTNESKTQQVGSESLLDTLEDLSNYAAMTACWLKGVQAEDDVINKSYHAVKDLIEKCDDSDEYNDVEKEIDVLLQKLFRMTENRKGYFATIEYLNDWNSIIIEISNIVKANNISDSHLMDLIFPYTRLESNTILYQVNRNKSNHEDIVVKTDNLEFRNKPSEDGETSSQKVAKFIFGDKNPCPDIVFNYKPQLAEELYNYIKENVDDCVTRICQLMSRGELPTIGGIEHWTYNIGRCAIDHYEDPYTIIEHVKDMPSFRVLSDKNAQLVINSIKNYITDFNKEKEASKLTDEAYDFLEEHIDRAVGYMTHVRAHGKVPQRLDVCDYAYDIARFAVEHYEDPFVIIQHMNRINSISVLDDDDVMLLHTSITNYIQEIMKKGPTFDKPVKPTDHLKKFVEEVTDDIISVVLKKQRDEEMLVPADLDDDTSRIIKCITDNEFDPNYVVSYMEALMGNAGIPPYLREWIRGIILRGVYYRNKGRSMTKAKDKARGVVMKGSRGNSNVIVMASRGSGKGLMKTKSLLEELGVPKEDIKEIFEGLEDDDE